MSTRKPVKLLLIEDDAPTSAAICRALEPAFGRHCVRNCASLQDAEAEEVNDEEIVLVGQAGWDGEDLSPVHRMAQQRRRIPVILILEEGQLDLADRGLRQGAYDYVFKTDPYLRTLPVVIEKNLTIWRTKRDNLRLQRQLTRALIELQVKNKQLEQAVLKFETMAATDPLTGLENRRSIAQALERCFAEAVRYEHDLACVMIDLDHFKQINDTLGHQAGDELLRSTARVLKDNCRKSDIAGRYGGDEFVVLMPQTDQTTAQRAARRIHEQFILDVLPQYAHCGGCASKKIGISMGVATLRLDKLCDPEKLITMADHALYQAKQIGKDQIVVYSHNDLAPSHSARSWQI